MNSSYPACSIPYWVAEDVPDGEQLVAQTPEAHWLRHRPAHVTDWAT
jgi:hypothetical protein